MNWEDVGKAVARSAPALGGVLAGPGGAAIGSVIASAFGVEGTPDAVAEAIKIDPQAAVKLREIERDERLGILQIRSQQAIAQIQSVNATMQAEGKSEHWAQYGWRPYIGFSFGTMGAVSGFTVLFSYLGVMFGQADAAVLGHIPGMLGAVGIVMGTMAPILGVAAWHRGKQKRETIATGAATVPVVDMLPSHVGRDET